MRLGLYRHYKNPDHLYDVLALALNVEDQQPMVVYRALYDIPELAGQYGMRPVFTRPYDVFFETVKLNGTSVPRFIPVDK